MPAATRLHDLSTQDLPSDEGSPTVFVNNLPWVRVTDRWRCPGSPPDGELTTGDLTVIVNNLEAGRIGDQISCPATVMTGSPNVFAGNAGSVGALEWMQDVNPWQSEPDTWEAR